MPRRSGSGGGFGRSSSPPPRQAQPTRQTAAPAQAPMRQAPPPVPAPVAQPASGGMFSGIGQTLVTGMAFGAGSEVAHQAVRGIMGMGGSSHQQQPQQQEQEPVQQQNNYNQKNQQCSYENQSFQTCLSNQNDVVMCSSYFDMLKECQKKYNI